MSYLLRTVLYAASLPAIAIAALAPAPEPRDWRQLFDGTFLVSRTNKPLVADYATELVSRGDVLRHVAGSGVVRPLVSVLVGSQLSGQIVEIKASFNAEVKAGDVLAVLDDKMYASRIAQAEAELAVAQAALHSQQAARGKALVQLRRAELDRGRQSVLMKSKSTTRSQQDEAEQSVEIAKAEVAAADAQMSSAAATIRNREAQLAQARIDLDRTQIRAPIDGVVLSRMVEVGQTVAASLQAPELFRIAKDLRNVQIEAQIGEADIAGIRKENAVTFMVDAYPDREFHGNVAEIRLAPAIEQNLVTYTVVVEADNADLQLLPGMTANLQIETARREQVVRVPADALRYRPPRGIVAAVPQTPRDPQTGSVWVLVPEGRIEPRLVRIGLSDGKTVEISGGGLEPGARVLVKGPARWVE